MSDTLFDPLLQDFFLLLYSIHSMIVYGEMLAPFRRICSTWDLFQAGSCRFRDSRFDLRSTVGVSSAHSDTGVLPENGYGSHANLLSPPLPCAFTIFSFPSPEQIFKLAESSQKDKELSQFAASEVNARTRHAVSGGK